MISWNLWKQYYKMKQFEMTAGIETTTSSSHLQRSF